jgi:hypothetical protein
VFVTLKDATFPQAIARHMQMSELGCVARSALFTGDAGFSSVMGWMADRYGRKRYYWQVGECSRWPQLYQAHETFGAPFDPGIAEQWSAGTMLLTASFKGVSKGQQRSIGHCF